VPDLPALPLCRGSRIYCHCCSVKPAVAAKVVPARDSGVGSSETVLPGQLWLEMQMLLSYMGLVARPESRVRALLYNLAAMLLGLALAVTVLEIALVWIVPPPLHYVYSQPPLRPRSSAWLGHEASSARLYDRQARGHQFAGVQVAEIPIRRDPGGLRILCLGTARRSATGWLRRRPTQPGCRRFLRHTAPADAWRS